VRGSRLRTSLARPRPPRDIDGLRQARRERALVPVDQGNEAPGDPRLRRAAEYAAFVYHAAAVERVLGRELRGVGGAHLDAADAECTDADGRAARGREVVAGDGVAGVEPVRDSEVNGFAARLVYNHRVARARAGCRFARAHLQDAGRVDAARGNDVAVYGRLGPEARIVVNAAGDASEGRHRVAADGDVDGAARDAGIDSRLQGIHGIAVNHHAAGA